MSSPVHTLEFRSEARQLLQLMIHSIYSNKDVFLRELVSNASDALDKLRLESFQDKDADYDVSDLHVAIETDPAARTLTVRDNGIGMTRDEKALWTRSGDHVEPAEYHQFYKHVSHDWQDPLAEGGELGDPTRFVRMLASRLGALYGPTGP